MTLPIPLGKISAKGSMNLFIGIVISTLILAACMQKYKAEAKKVLR